MVTGTVPPGLFFCFLFLFFLLFFFDPLLAREEGRVGLFILGSPPQQRFVYTGPATQLCTTACLSWDRPPAVQSVAPAAQPKTETTTKGGQPKHPKGTTNNGDPKGRGRQPAKLEPKWLEPKWLRPHLWAPPPAQRVASREDEEIRSPLIVKEHTSDLSREARGSWGSSLSCALEV